MMIDASRQGRGYGSAALRLVLEYIKTKPFGDFNRVTLTCNKNNQVALELYHKAGFVETGEEDDEEIELSQRLYQYVTLREMPAVKEQAAEWFHSKWGVSKEAYLECMNAYLKKETEYCWHFWLSPIDAAIYAVFILFGKIVWHMVDFGVSMKTAADINRLIRNRKRNG